MFSDFNHSLLPSRAPDFNQPLELLKACHEKIRFHLDLLIRLCEYLKNNPVDTDALETAKQIHRYFSSSAKLHHEDEDENLFPVLLSKPDIPAKARDLINQLQQEHISLNKQWQVFEKILANQFLGESPDQSLNQSLNKLPAMLEAALILQKNYAQHIENENQVVLPEAEILLNDDEKIQLGQAMQTRRRQAANPVTG